MELQLFWFVMLGVLLVGYAVLDGFDLGVGILHPVAKTDLEKRVFMNAIGPLWDGNEVWLVTFGGALFAAFPEVYATAFSGFYLAFMLLLCALIFRAVSMEFRSKRESRVWRGFFDAAFCTASTVATLLMGVAVGNAIWGLPIERAQYVGTFFDLLHPYSLLVGVLTVALFALHGSTYLYLKTEGELQQRLKPVMWRCFWLFLVLYLAVTGFSVVALPQATANLRAHLQWGWVIVGLNVLAVANIPRCIHHDKPMQTFISTGCTIAALVFLFGAALYPNLLVSSFGADESLTIHNASSSELTLEIMRVIAFLGVPFVLAYTAAIYWVFRGKVKLSEFSY